MTFQAQRAKFCPPAAAMLWALLVTCAAAFGQDAPVKISSAWSVTAARPGDSVNLAIVLDIPKPFHINPADAPKPFIATRVEVTQAPDGLRMSTPSYPASHPFEFSGFGEKQTIQVYSDRAVIFIPMALGGDLKPGELKLEVSVTYQACDDQVCLRPVTEKLTPTLNIVPAGTAVEPANADLFASFQGERLGVSFFGLADFDIDPSNLLVLLGLAIVGGFLLNLTPCVLPLIPIKVMSLGQAAAGHRSRGTLLALAMTAGIIGFWLVLAVAITTISGFGAVNQLFQYPQFTITVGLLIAVMALGMTGLFAVRLPQAVYMVNPKHDTLTGSLLFGVMTAVLSTPCTAPFMGTAVLAAAGRGAGFTLPVFAAVGVGMALPYLVLSLFPGAMRWLPKTGPASELLKQIMGLLMLGAAAYFVGTGLVGLLSKAPDPPSRMYWWAVALFIAAGGVWLIWGTIKVTRSTPRRVVFIALGLLLLASAGHVGFRFTDRGPINWIYYTPERLAAAQQQKKAVVLEFTAEWCLNCKALEEAVLAREEVYRRMNASDVAAVKVDLTGDNAAGNAKLQEVGRRTIPLLVIYAADGREVFRSDAYTVQQVVDALDKARGVTTAAQP